MTANGPYKPHVRFLEAFGGAFGERTLPEGGLPLGGQESTADRVYTAFAVPPGRWP